MIHGRLALCIVALCTVLCAACSTPGETRASFNVQNTVHKFINKNEIAHKEPYGAVVTDTKVVSEDYGTVVENWYVRRGESQVIYVVKLTPDKHGGMDVKITPPDGDGK